jgi:hypothetical protein
MLGLMPKRVNSMPRAGVLAMTALAVLSVLWQPASAEDPPAKLVAALGKIVPNVDPDRIERSAVAGLYEVSFGAMVVYVFENGRIIPGYVSPRELLEMLEENKAG